MPVNIPYSPEEDSIIQKMHAKGYSYHDISKVLITRSPRSIKEHAYDLGIKWTPDPKIDMEAFTRMMKEAKAIKCL